MFKNRNIKISNLFLFLFFTLGFSFDTFAENIRRYKQNIIDYTPIVKNGELSAKNGSFIGVHNDKLIIAGGIEGDYDYSNLSVINTIDEIHLYSLADPGGELSEKTPQLDKPIAFGASAITEDGLLCIGGTDGRMVFNKVFLLSYNVLEDEIIISPMPSLPKGVAFCSGITIGSKVYVLGGSYDPEGKDLNSSVYLLDMLSDNPTWQVNESSNFEGCLQPALAVQHDGFGNKIYIFRGSRVSGSSNDFLYKQNLNAGYKLDPENNNFENVSEIPFDYPCFAVDVGQSHIFLYPKDAKNEVFAYHSITDSWAAINGYEGPGEVLSVLKHSGITSIIGIDEKDDLSVTQADVILKNTRFGFLDYSCLIVYLLALVLMGFYFSKREKTTEDFFLGGKRVPFWAAGLSLIGTGLSAITYIATPAKAYASDWHRLVMPLLMPLGIFVQIYLMLPFFRRLNVTTAYEYLEYRFNIIIRIFASLSFIILQLGRMGVVLFLPAIALSASTGMNVYVCILFMGVLCTIYTVLGGIEAVIWTDVIQVIIFYSCAFMVLVTIIFSLEGGINEFYSISVENSKFKMIYPGWDLTSVSITVMVLATFANILLPMTDQTIVQRWLTTKDEKNARKAIITGALVGIPSAIIFFLIGASLFAFYKTHPEKLNPELMTDGIVPWFAVQQLPAGISGVLIAAIFAASMSSMDSSMNSLATAIVTDFYKRFKPRVLDHSCLVLARWLTVLFGVFGTSMALLFASTDIKSLADLISRYNGLFGGGLAGVFLLGMLTKRTNVVGCVVGITISAISVYYVQSETRISFFLYFVVGLFSCVLVGYLASIITSSKKIAPEGTTIYSIIKEEKS